MKRSRSGLSARRVIVAVGAVAIIAGLAGCASGASATPEATIDVTATPSLTTPVTAVTDKQSCEEFGDVSTILQNASADLHSQRMTQQEYNGWLQLASRVLGRIPTRGEGDVSNTIEALKKVAPAIPAGKMGATGFDTPEWNIASLFTACDAAGVPFITEGFTGG